MKNYRAAALIVVVLSSGCAARPSESTGQPDVLAPVKKAVSAGAYIIDVTDRTPATVTQTNGGGIHIGNGFILTAAHVLGSSPKGKLVNVVMNGWVGDAKIVAKPDAFAPGHNDVAVLRVSPIWSAVADPAPFYPLCLSAPKKGAEVYVVSRGSIDFKKLDWQAEEMPPQLVATYEGGKSGSGVVDAKRECVTGIISYGSKVDFTDIEVNSVRGLSDAGGIAYTPSSEIIDLLKEWGVPFATVQ